MARTKVLVLFALMVMVHQALYGQCACPEGIGAKPGDPPFTTIAGIGGGGQVLFCGHVDKNIANGVWKASGFEVIESATGKPLLAFDALEECFIRKETSDRVTIEKLVFLPIGESFGFEDVPLERYTIAFDAQNNPTVEKEFVFSPPSFSKREEVEILEEYAERVKTWEAGGDMDSIVGKLALLAMSGSEAGREAFERAPKTLHLDGCYGEYHTELMRIYREHFSPAQR